MASERPRNLVEFAADQALDAMKSELALYGAEVDKAFVLLIAKDVPEGTVDAVTAGTGIEDVSELLALLVGHMVRVAESIGMTVQLVPIGKRLGEG